MDNAKVAVAFCTFVGAYLRVKYTNYLLCFMTYHNLCEFSVYETVLALPELNLKYKIELVTYPSSMKCHLGIQIFIGVGRFRILGRQKLGGQGGGADSQQAHDVVMTSMRRNNVA